MTGADTSDQICRGSEGQEKRCTTSDLRHPRCIGDDCRGGGGHFRVEKNDVKTERMVTDYLEAIYFRERPILKNLRQHDMAELYISEILYTILFKRRLPRTAILVLFHTSASVN